jgi:hypothetical protein
MGCVGNAYVDGVEHEQDADRGHRQDYGKDEAATQQLEPPARYTRKALES